MIIRFSKLTKAISFTLGLSALVLPVITLAQYYPPQPAYDPYATPGSYQPNPGYGQQPTTYPPVQQGYGYPQQQQQQPYGYTPPVVQGPPSPFSTGDSASFSGGSLDLFGAPSTPPPADSYGSTYPPATTTTYPPTDGTAMMAYSPAVASVAGFKFSYAAKYGDYFSTQSRNAPRWDQFPVTLHLSFPEDMAEGDIRAVKEAVNAWSKYAEITLVEQPDQAKIELTWVSELEDDTDLGETDFRQTHFDSMGRVIADKAMIRMLDPEKYVGINPGVLKAATMHQLGHALGIGSHSDNDRDLMAEPAYKDYKVQMVAKAVKTLASKTVGKVLGFSLLGDSDDKKKTIGPPVEKITKRDLNTLFRIYN